MKDSKKGKQEQEWREVSSGLQERLVKFLGEFLWELDERIDKRLVRTMVLTIGAIIELRHPGSGLLLSELGGHILNPWQAPAGTKRVSNLLLSGKWHYGLIERFLWRQGDERIAELQASGEEALAIWDESVLEKPESRKLEGLCAVRSSVAGQLKRIKPGFYNPPSKPLFVPGMNWLSVLVMGMSGAPTVASMRWWSSRGVGSSDKRTEEGKLLDHCCKRWGQRVLHVFDRGFAGSPWLQQLLKRRQRFVMRWRQEYNLVDSKGNKRKAWQICCGKRSFGQRTLWDASRHCERKIGIYYTQVTHPDFPSAPLWLVVSRQGKGRSPWYLLTNQPVNGVDPAFSLIRAYARRWQIEMAWRYTKSELAFESPRLHRWHNRLKLLLIATLAYAFLLSLLDPLLKDLRHRLLRQFCHRTGKRCRDASTPLYRLRDALAKLWSAYPRLLDPLSLLLNSG
jgi:hypothetical protein